MSHRLGVTFACALVTSACGYQHGRLGAEDGGVMNDSPDGHIVVDGQDGQMTVGPDALDAFVQLQYARMIDLTDAEVIGGPHADFPLLVSLQETWLRHVTQGGDVQNLSGFDVVFSADAAGTTPLAHELERYDATTGRLVAWVKLPTLTSSTVLYLRYGDPAIATSQENVAAVWSGGYAAVWHLDPDLADSAAANAGANSGSVEATGVIGSGRMFDGADDYIDTGSGAGIDDVFTAGGTAEAWCYANSYGESSRGRLFEKGDAAGGTGAAGWLLSVDNINVSTTVFFAHGTNSTLAGWDAPAGAFSLNAWNHVAVVYDQDSMANDPQLFINGVSVAVTQTFTGGSISSDAAYSLRLGNRIAGDRAFDGLLDEARLSTVSRSAGWIATSYRNQQAPSGFYTVGPVLP